jgi:hypothetical protein
VTEEEKTKTKTARANIGKIEVYGVPQNTSGILMPHNIMIKRDDEIVPRLTEFEFNVKVDGAPMVKMVSYSSEIDVRLEGVHIDHEIRALRIFDQLKGTLKDMDYAFQVAWKDGKTNSWKFANIDDLKESLDKVHAHLGTVIEQFKKGERDLIDAQMFAIKVANYGMLLADRIDRILKEKKKIVNAYDAIKEKKKSGE